MHLIDGAQIERNSIDSSSSFSMSPLIATGVIQSLNWLYFASAINTQPQSPRMSSAFCLLPFLPYTLLLELARVDQTLKCTWRYLKAFPLQCNMSNAIRVDERLEHTQLWSCCYCGCWRCSIFHQPQRPPPSSMNATRVKSEWDGQRHTRRVSEREKSPFHSLRREWECKLPGRTLSLALYGSPEHAHTVTRVLRSSWTVSQTDLAFTEASLP